MKTNDEVLRDRVFRQDDEFGGQFVAHGRLLKPRRVGSQHANTPATGDDDSTVFDNLAGDLPALPAWRNRTAWAWADFVVAEDAVPALGLYRSPKCPATSWRKWTRSFTATRRPPQ